MRKIPTIFERDWDGDRSRVLAEPVAGCEWVFAGEGVATRKFDGTACWIDGGILYKRFALPEGRDVPDGFVGLDWEGEEGKRKLIGWLPVGDGPEDRWHREARCETCPDGTYELVGPKVQGNPEGYIGHILIPHGEYVLEDAPRDFDGLTAFFVGRDIEGIVWHHPDGRMAKIKARDFGVSRPKIA